jgi:manganese/zinc/iron transport system substrate-binding protein
MNGAKTMKVFFTIWCVLLAAIAIYSCSNNQEKEKTQLSKWRTPNNKVKVLSTIAMIDDLVHAIGGDYVDTLTLIKSELDPHSYQLVKGDDEKLAFADLIFFNDLGLEHGASLKSYLNNANKAVSLGILIMNQNAGEIIYCHGQADPHLWMDISLWAKAIPFITEALSKKDPEHTTQYKENAQKLLEEMKKLHLTIKYQMQSIPSKKRYLVTSHDAFNYFTRAYLADPDEIEMKDWGKRFAAPEGLSPESQLCTRDIQFIIDHLKKYQITTLFTETNVSKDSIKKILQAGNEHGLKLRIARVSLYADSMGPPGSDGDTYLKMVRHNADTIKKFIMEENDSPAR